MGKGKTAKAERPVDPEVQARADRLYEQVRYASGLDDLFSSILCLFSDVEAGPVAYKRLNFQKLRSFGGKRPRSARVVSWDAERVIQAADDGSWMIAQRSAVEEDEAPVLQLVPQNSGDDDEPPPPASAAPAPAAPVEGQDGEQAAPAAQVEPAPVGPPPDAFRQLLVAAFVDAGVVARDVRVKLVKGGAALGFDVQVGKKWVASNTTLPLLLWRDAGPDLAVEIAQGIVEGLADA